MNNNLVSFIKDQYKFSDNLLGYPVSTDYDDSNVLELFKSLGHVMLNNVGDPWSTANSKNNSKQHEIEVIKYFSKLYNIENDFWGYVTNGSTEGNLQGLYLGRELLKSCKDVKCLFSNESHYSIDKASKILNLEALSINSTANGEIDYNALGSYLNTSGAYIINLNIGTTMDGAIDSVSRLLDNIHKYGVKKYYIHADAALYGPVYKYMDRWEDLFKVGVSSIAISTHKFLNVPLVSGIFLTRKTVCDQLDSLETVDYIRSNDTTISGSRSGLITLLIWTKIFQRKNNLAEEFKNCIKLAEYFVHQMQKINNSQVIYNRGQIIVSFSKPCEELCKKYQLATKGNKAHIVFMQDVKKEIVKKFISDYSKDTLKRH